MSVPRTDIGDWVEGMQVKWMLSQLLAVMLVVG